MSNSGDNIIYIDDGKKKISISISNKQYDVIISAGRLLLPHCDVDDDFNYRQYVSNELFEAIQSDEKPQIEDIEVQNNEFFVEIFDALLYNANDFYTILDKIHCDEICEKYIRAYSNYCIKNIHKAFEHENRSLSNAISSMESSIKSTIEDINSSYFTSLFETIRNAFSWYASNAETIASSISATLDSFSKLGQSLISSIYDIIGNIEIPEVSEKRKKELINTYKQWGKYGWTVPPFAEINCFNTHPNSQIEADEIALKYCQNNDIQQLFTLLLENCPRKKDIKEAIDCYNEKHYKACAMILFSIIDSRVIRLQNKKEKRMTGVNAILKFKDATKQQATGEGKLFLALNFANLFPCLLTMFDDTENFTKKSTVINRNYLDHGMSYKTVRKKDCIKVFLLLYNLLEFIDIMK